jgi:hypothetical protein
MPHPTDAPYSPKPIPIEQQITEVCRLLRVKRDVAGAMRNLEIREERERQIEVLEAVLETLVQVQRTRME